MPALCSMLWLQHYAQNYAGIIHLILVRIFFMRCKGTRRFNQPFCSDVNGRNSTAAIGAFPRDVPSAVLFRAALQLVSLGDLRHPCLCDFLSTVPVDVVMAKSNISVMLFNLHRSTSLAGVNFNTLHGNPVNHAILFCLVKWPAVYKFVLFSGV